VKSSKSPVLPKKEKFGGHSDYIMRPFLKKKENKKKEKVHNNVFFFRKGLKSELQNLRKTNKVITLLSPAVLFQAHGGHHGRRSHAGAHWDGCLGRCPVCISPAPAPGDPEPRCTHKAGVRKG
jgi:hypothetical protein